MARVNYKHRRLAKIIMANARTGRKLSKKQMANMAGLSAYPQNPDLVRIPLINYGFTVDNAQKVVGEILSSEVEESGDRLRSAELVFKVHGVFAPDKLLTINGSISDILDAIDKRERGS